MFLLRCFLFLFLLLFCSVGSLTINCCAQAWYTCDECDALLQSEGSALLNAMQQAHERIHRLDDRPVLHVYGGVVPYHHKGEPRGPWTALVNSSDVVGFDAYPFGACTDDAFTIWLRLPSR